MARGESQKARGASSAIGLWAVLGVLVLGVGLLLAFTMRDCDPFDTVGPVGVEPYPGSVNAFEGLGDRDCPQGYLAMGERPDDVLRARGYRPAGEAISVDLPFEGPAEPLEGACGVAVFLAETGTTLEHVESRELRSAPCASRIASVALCGKQVVRASGTGRVELAYWTYPGLTPSDVENTGLSPEQALALAEAEHTLHRRGYRATHEAIRVELGASVSSWDPPAPASGCVPWVVAAVGFDDLVASTDLAPEFHRDGRAGRQLVGAVSCAGSGGRLRVTDAHGNGGTLVALPFERHGGPQMPGEESAALSTVAEVRVRTEDELTLPEPIPTHE